MSHAMARIFDNLEADLLSALARLGGRMADRNLLKFKIGSPCRSNLPAGSTCRRYPRLTEFLGDPQKLVEQVFWANHIVWIDKAQTTDFKGVPEAVWQFHIGGYKVSEKWLKDRKGRTLSAADLAHYDKIVIVPSKSLRLMVKLGTVIERHGSGPLRETKRRTICLGNLNCSSPPKVTC